MTCQKVYLISVINLSTFLKFYKHESESTQRISHWKHNSIKALYSEPAQQEFGNILKIARTASVMKYFFNKIPDMQYTFAEIRL